MLTSLLFWVLVAQGADATTSYLGYRAGCGERAPGGYPAMFTAKGVTVASFTYAWGKEGKDKKKLPKIVGGILVGTGTIATVNNVRVLRAGCR